jgi:hypothetical protein
VMPNSRRALPADAVAAGRAIGRKQNMTRTQTIPETFLGVGFTRRSSWGLAMGRAVRRRGQKHRLPWRRMKLIESATRETEPDSRSRRCVFPSRSRRPTRC